MIMKLGKLLGAGKSFFGGGGLKAYRENKHVYLPKFNAEKNPFTPKESGAASAASAPEPAVGKVSAPAPPSAPVSLAKTQKMAAPSVLRPVRAANWTHKLNPFRAPEPAAPPTVHAVQVELSLDAVKPIGNDLADADIEFVPVKSRTVMPAEPSLLPASHEAWNFAGERMTTPV